LIEKPYFLMVSRKLASGNPALAQRLWKTIEEVRTSPAYQKLEHEHADAIGK
jgi:polar amino acid transport system substrate-binding protein